MTALTGLDRPVLAFGWHGVLSRGGRADLTPLAMALEAGCYAGIMTCGAVAHVAAVVESHGIPALADAAMSIIVPWFPGLVLVTGRRLLADLYIEDRALRYQPGTDPGLIFAALGARREGAS